MSRCVDLQGDSGADLGAGGARRGQRVALKLQKSAPEYTRAAQSEIEILDRIAKAEGARLARGGPEGAKGHCGVVRLLNHFKVVGPHGQHVAMAFELLGETLLSLLQRRGPLDARAVKGITRELLRALDFIHADVNILHTDIKPENVLVLAPGGGADDAAAPPPDVKLVDLGTAFYVAHQQAHDIQTREYRCPEAIVGAWPYAHSADVWSLGCLVFELLTGETLFDPQSPQPGEAYTKDESHLAQVIELLGTLPPPLVARGRRAAQGGWFGPEGPAPGDGPQLRRIQPPESHDGALEAVLVENFGLDADEGAGAAAFLKRLLMVEPSDRLTAREALQEPWLNSTHEL